jgi:protease I
MKALIVLADGFEDLHLFSPWFRLREEDAEVTVASPTGKPVTGLRGHVVRCDMPIREVNPSEYDLLVIPGGYSPEKLRLREEAVDVARTFLDEGRRVAAIGHAAQLLISAGGVMGRRLTSAPEVRDDVRAAGGTYTDEPVVADGCLITCRDSDALPPLCRAMLAGLTVRG